MAAPIPPPPWINFKAPWQNADELAAASDPSSAQAIRDATKEVTSQPPSDADVARVRARLAEGGWPREAGRRPSLTCCTPLASGRGGGPGRG